MPPPLFQTLVRNIPTVAPVPHRAVLSLAGSQAPEFLNGILASLVREPRGPLYSAFLHAQGRVLYDIFLYTKTDSTGQRSYLLEYDPRPSDAPPMMSLLKRYILRSKVKVRDVSEEYDVWAAWGGSKNGHWETPRKWTWARSGVVEPKWDPAESPWGTQDESIFDRRAVGMGRRFIVKKGDRPQEASDHDIAPSDAYVLHRILNGVPEGLTDIHAMQAFPMDSNLDIMGGLDFRKGCYVGQELTVRTYHTGAIRKRILPVAVHQPDQIPQEIITPSPEALSYPSNVDIRASVIQTDDGRHVPRPRGNGKLLSSHQGVGLALLRLEHVEGAQKGDLRLEFDIVSDGNTTAWAVSPWWPSWWPHRLP